MIILRQKGFSKKLPESRTGIGWIQEELGKNESEKYFKIGQKVADKSYDNKDEDEVIIKKSKRQSGNKVILDNSVKPIFQGVLAGGAGYLAAKSPKIVESVAKTQGVNVVIPNFLKNMASKHAGKIALGTGILVAGKHIPDIYKKQKAVRTGVEINTRDRIKKKNRS